MARNSPVPSFPEVLNKYYSNSPYYYTEAPSKNCRLDKRRQERVRNLLMQNRFPGLFKEEQSIDSPLKRRKRGYLEKTKNYYSRARKITKSVSPSPFKYSNSSEAKKTLDRINNLNVGLPYEAKRMHDLEEDKLSKTMRIGNQFICSKNSTLFEDPRIFMNATLYS